jgi:ribosomal-protein-alanine N-acetyltransferase
MRSTPAERIAPTLMLGEARLRALRPSDAAALLDYLGDARVTARTSFPEVTPALADAMIERARRRWAAGEPGRWGLSLQADDRVVGTCGFNDFSRDHRVAELAYDLSVAHWGSGLMTRAAGAAVRWVFEHGEVDRVQAYVRVDNTPSVRLLERLGFTCEGRLRGFRLCRGLRHDFHVFGLLRSEWSPGSSAGTGAP